MRRFLYLYCKHFVSIFFYSTEIENVWTSTSLLFSLGFRAPPSCFKRRCKSSTWSNAEILPVHRSTEIRSQRSQNNLEPVRTEHSTATEVKLPPCCGELWAVAPRAKRAQRHVACVSQKMHVCSPNIITLGPDRLQEIVFITAKYITWPSKARDELCPSKREPSNIHEAKYQSQSQPGSPPLPEVSQDAAGPEKDKKRLKLLSFKNLGFSELLVDFGYSGSWRHGFGMRCIVSRTLLISGPWASFRSTTLAASQRRRGRHGKHEWKFHRSFTSVVMFKVLVSVPGKIYDYSIPRSESKRRLNGLACSDGACCAKRRNSWAQTWSARPFTFYITPIHFSHFLSLMTPSSQPRLLQPPAILPGQPWQHGHGHGCGSGLARRLVMRVSLQISHRSLQQNNEFHVNFICNIIIYNYYEFIIFLRQLAKATTWAALSSIGSSAAIATSTTHAPSRWPKCERML